jgi:hypothetical protein
VKGEEKTAKLFEKKNFKTACCCIPFTLHPSLLTLIPDNISEHSGENKEMEGEDRVPVQAAEDAFGAKGSRLFEEQGVSFFVNHIKLQPGLTGKFHFRIEQQVAFLPVGLNDAPEIQGVAGMQLLGMGAAPSQAYPA